MHKTNEVDDYVLSNREKSQMIGKDKFWCNGCDRSLVGEIGKCPVCGHINGKGQRIKL